MDYQPKPKDTHAQKAKPSAFRKWTAITLLSSFALGGMAGCSNQGNQNSYNKIPSSPPSSQKMVDAKPNLKIVDNYHVMVMTRDNKAVTYDLSKEMAIQKVGSLEGATWDSMDDKDGTRIYTVYPKNSNSTLAIILAPPQDDDGTVKTKNAQL